MSSLSHRTRRATAVFLLMTAQLFLVGAAASADESLPDHADHTTHVIGIARGALFPTVRQIAPEDAFGWLNYSASDATISFEDDIVAHMTCRGPSPFQLRGDKLMAPKIPSGGYATLCSLAPGEYDYRVEFAGTDKPLLGKIVVASVES